MTPEARLQARGLVLPTAPRPVGSYVPCVQMRDVVYVSGQLPVCDGALIATGKVGGEITVEQGAEAAAQAVLNGLAHIAQQAGGLSRVVRIVRLGVFVNSAAGFTSQSSVANGASDLLYEVFGEAGRHARVAVGVSDLPMNAPVEVELTVQVRP